jgi:hypothetical protein
MMVTTSPQNNKNMKKYYAEAAIIAAGIVLMGICLYGGLSQLAHREREVSVRGLAEREVAADHVTWPLVYKTTGNDLQVIYADVQNANTKISQFLRKNGIRAEEISESAPQIIDMHADRYNTQRTADRYNVTSVITVATSQVNQARELMRRLGELLKEGIAISAGDYETRVQYEFLGLNKIKPEMIEEATRNAREVAEKFAADSGSELGKIKNASQGLFSINDRDQYTPHIKKVRVVTSVNYYLEN